MEERYHATTQNRFYPHISNSNKNITVEAKLISPPTYISRAEQLRCEVECWGEVGTVRGKERGDYLLCSQPQNITSLTFFLSLILRRCIFVFEYFINFPFFQQKCASYYDDYRITKISVKCL